MGSEFCQYVPIYYPLLNKDLSEYLTRCPVWLMEMPSQRKHEWQTGKYKKMPLSNSLFASGLRISPALQHPINNTGSSLVHYFAVSRWVCLHEVHSLFSFYSSQRRYLHIKQVLGISPFSKRHALSKELCSQYLCCDEQI